ncbi:conserved Plasmodium protein, unknown function [Plasmodium berghei]|uniref:Uncharacterized protein n=1 Tax=Plasmodium berghei TaxID=5821 RepID=A0A1D3Q5G3_PLABE|nr:conserved Plasmodium protein, unknown function [Plasmodium berghei]
MVRNKKMNSNVDLCVNHVDINNTYVDILNIHETLVNHIQAIAPQFYSLVETNFNLKNETNEIIKSVSHDNSGNSENNNNNNNISYIDQCNNNLSFKKNTTHSINNKDNIKFSKKTHIYNLYTNNYAPNYYDCNSISLNADEASNKCDEYINYEISDKKLLSSDNLLYKKNKTEQIIKLKEKNTCFINTTYGNYDSKNKCILKNTDEQKKQLYECSNICKTPINIDHVNDTIYSRQLDTNINDSNVANSENFIQINTSQKNKECIKNIRYPGYYLNLNGQDQIIDKNINDIVPLGKQVRNSGSEYLGGCNVVNLEKEIKICENMEKYVNYNDHNDLKMGAHSNFEIQYCTNCPNLKKYMIKINNVENCLKNTCTNHNYMNKSGKNEKYENVYTLNSDENDENNLNYEIFFPNNLNNMHVSGNLEAFGTKLSKYDINTCTDIKKYNEVNNHFNFLKHGQQIHKPIYYNNCRTNDDTYFSKDINHSNKIILNICDENNLFNKLNKENYVQMGEEMKNYVHSGKMQFDFIKNETNSKLSIGEKNKIYKFEPNIIFDQQIYNNMKGKLYDNYYSNHSSKENNNANDQDNRTHKYDENNNNKSSSNDTTSGGGIGIGLNNKNTSGNNDDGNDDDDKSRDGDKQNCNYHEINDEEAEDKNKNDKKNQDDEINEKQANEINNKKNSNEQIVTHIIMDNNDDDDNNNNNNNNNAQTNGQQFCDSKNCIISKINESKVAPNDINNNNNYIPYNKSYASDSTFTDVHTYDRNADTESINNFVDSNMANSQEDLNILNKHNNHVTNINEGNYFGNGGRASHVNRNNGSNVNFSDNVHNRFSKSNINNETLINNIQILNGNKNENSFRNIKKKSINDITMNAHNYNNEVGKDFPNNFPGKYSTDHSGNYSGNISTKFSHKFSNNDMHNMCDNIYNNYNINTNDQNSKCLNDVSNNCVETDLMKFTNNTYIDIHKIIKNDDMLKMEFTKMEDCFKNVPISNKVSSIDGTKTSGDSLSDPNPDKIRINNKKDSIRGNGINRYNGGGFKSKSKNNSKDNDVSCPNLKKYMIKINNVENCLKNTCTNHNYMNKSGKNEKYENVYTLNSDENDENNLNYEIFFPNNLNNMHVSGNLEAFGTKLSKYDINTCTDIKKYNEVNNHFNFLKHGQQIHKPIYYNNCRTNDDTYFSKDINHSNKIILNICDENNLFNKLNKENYVQMGEEMKNYVHSGKMQFDFIKNETNSKLSIGEKNKIYKFEPNIIFDQQIYNNMKGKLYDNYYSNHSSKENNNANDQDNRTHKYDENNNNKSSSNDTTSGGGIGIGLNNKNTSGNNDDGNDDDDKSRDGDKQNCNYHEINDEEAEDKNKNDKKNQDDEINEKQANEINNKKNSNEQIVTHIIMDNNDDDDNNNNNNNNNAQTNGQQFCDSKNCIISKINESKVAPNDINNNNNYIPYNKSYASDSTFTDVHTYDRNADTESINNFVDSNMANSQEDLNILNKHNNHVTNINEGNYFGNGGRASHVNRNNGSNVNFSDNVHNRFSKSNINNETLINNIQILNGNKNENSFRNIKKKSINDITMNAHNYNNEVGKDFPNNFPGKYSTDHSGNYSGNISTKFSHKFSNNDMHNMCDNIYNNYNINTNDQNSKCLNDVSNNCVETDLMKFTNNTYIDIHKIIKNDDMLKMEFTKMEDCFKNVPISNKVSSIDGTKTSGDSLSDPNPDKIRINNKKDSIRGNGINRYNGGGFKSKSKNNSKDNDVSRMYDNYKQLLTLDDTMIDGYNNQNFDELYFLQNNNIHPNVLNDDIINDSIINNNIEKIIDIMNINNENIINKNIPLEGNGNMVVSGSGGTGFVASPPDVSTSHLANVSNKIMINNRSNCNPRDSIKNMHNNIPHILQQNAYIQGKEKKRKITCISTNNENPCTIINKLDNMKDCGILKEFDDNKCVNTNNTRYNKDKKKIYQKMDIRMLNKTVQKNKEICTNCYIHYDHSKSSYILTFINRKQKKQRKIFPVEPNEKDEPYIIKIVNYINKLKEENKIYGVNANGNMKEIEEGKNNLEYNKQPLVDFSNNPHRSNIIKPVINNIRIENTIDNNKRTSIYGVSEGNRNNNFFDTRNSSNIGVYINPKQFANTKPIHNEQQYGEDGNLIIKKNNNNNNNSNNTGINNMRSGNSFTKQFPKIPYTQPNNMNYAHNDIANINNRSNNFIKPLNYFDNISASQNMDFINYNMANNKIDFNMVNNTCAEEKQPINMFYDHDNNNSSNNNNSNNNNNNNNNGNGSKQVDGNYVADMNIIHNMNSEIASSLNGGLNQNMRMANINYAPNINENCNRINSVPLHINHNINNHFHTNMNDINNNSFGNNFYDNIPSDINGKNSIYPFSNIKGMNIMNANNNQHSSISPSGCGTITANSPSPNNSIKNNQHNNTNNLLVNQNDEYHSANIMNNMNFNIYSGNIPNNDDTEIIKNYNNIINDYQRNIFNSNNYGNTNSMESILSLRGGSVHNNE